MSVKRLSVEFQDHVAVIRMNDGKKNFICMDFLLQFNEALDQILHQPSTSVLVTTGSGRFFNNGIDLMWVSGLETEEINAFMEKLAETIARLVTLPLITVAALNGHAFAGGAFLSYAHDYIVMNEAKGWISINEVWLPSRIPFFLLDVLKAKIPKGHAQTEIITFGKRLTAKDGVRLGVVHRTTGAADTVVPAAIGLASSILELGTPGRDALGWMKRDLYETALKRMKTEFNPRMISRL